MNITSFINRYTQRQEFGFVTDTTCYMNYNWTVQDHQLTLK